MLSYAQRLAAVLSLTLLAQGCSSVYEVTGIVVDGDGQPVSIASISLYPYDEVRRDPSMGGQSGADGTFRAGYTGAPGIEFFRMVIVKEGFVEKTLLVEANEQDVRVVLERASATVR